MKTHYFAVTIRKARGKHTQVFHFNDFRFACFVPFTESPDSLRQFASEAKLTIELVYVDGKRIQLYETYFVGYDEFAALLHTAKHRESINSNSRF